MAIPPELRKYTQRPYWWRRAGLPEGLIHLTWGDLDGIDSEVRGYAEEIADLWDDGGFQGIALFGKPGRGKTSLTVVMAKAHIDRWLARQDFPAVVDAWPPAIFTTLSEYHRLGFEQLEVSRMIDRAPEDWNTLADEWIRTRDRRRYIESEVPVLVLDDVGKEHRSRSGFTESGFYALMRGRWSRGLATSMTSNLSAAEFVEAYGQAQFSFLHEACLVLDIDGPDFRLVNA